MPHPDDGGVARRHGNGTDTTTARAGFDRRPGRGGGLDIGAAPQLIATGQHRIGIVGVENKRGDEERVAGASIANACIDIVGAERRGPAIGTAMNLQIGVLAVKIVGVAGVGRGKTTVTAKKVNPAFGVAGIKQGAVILRTAVDLAGAIGGGAVELGDAQVVIQLLPAVVWW